ncbi:MAG: hypothetical protein JEY79_03665 [Pseudodesulfovibrio sp.]|nr:hypothetical protein [Pseudodesulfovibrio sp.]
MSDHIHELFDKDGNPIGALLSAEAWTAVKSQVFAKLGLVDDSVKPENAEPTSDWETLKSYWDYPYPIDTDVHCECCGNKTSEWAADEPRLFRLTSANLAGLVSFKCMNCQAKVVKKHFSKEIRTECTPFLDSKDKSKEGRYNR